jgi:hypothetical protein
LKRLISMEEPWVIVLLTVAGIVVLRLIVALLLAGGDMGRIGLAIRCSWKALRDPEARPSLEAILSPPPPKDAGPPRPDARPLCFLTLLQREGRLLDFLLEDVQAYADAQIGAAVRDIHAKCQAALKEHLVLEPVLDRPEQSTVNVPAGFDPSAIRLTGNVTGDPPFQGTLQHHGWRAKEIRLAPPPEGQDEMILMPAEVELP